MSVDGHCDPSFEGVREVFAASLAAGDDLGAALAVQVGGRTVVDLWGGTADRRTGRAWERDTACVTFSATKAVTATAALLLAERGAVDLAAPVSSWWPTFATAGKEAATGVHLLSHQVGLPAFDRPVPPERAADPLAMAGLLAVQPPLWPPGTDHGYHAVTFGWLAGELVRHHAGVPVGEFVEREIAADLRVGVPESALPSLARVCAGRPSPLGRRRIELARVARLVDADGDPDSLLSRSTRNPSVSFNAPVLLTAGWPAAGLVCTARALADFYARLVAGKVVSPALLADATRDAVRGPDRTLVLDSAFGLGYMRPSESFYLPPAAGGGFGHPGASGAIGFGDVDAGVAIGYIPNLTKPALGDRRGYRIVEAVYAALWADL